AMVRPPACSPLAASSRLVSRSARGTRRRRKAGVMKHVAEVATPEAKHVDERGPMGVGRTRARGTAAREAPLGKQRGEHERERLHAVMVWKHARGQIGGSHVDESRDPQHALGFPE